MSQTQLHEEEFNTLKTAAQALIDRATRERRDFTRPETAEQERRFARLEEIKRERERDDSAHRATFVARSRDDGRETYVTNAPGRPAAATFARGDTVEEQIAILNRLKLPGERDKPLPAGGTAGEVYAAAPAPLGFTGRQSFAAEVNRFAFTGELGTLCQRYATITGSTEGGALMPREVVAPIVPPTVNAFRYAHEVHNVQPVETARPHDMTLPVFDATAGTIVAENAGADTENEPSLMGSMNLNVRTHQSGEVWFSDKLLLASAFDMAAAILPQLAMLNELRFEIETATAIINDAGVTQEVATSTTAGFTYANLLALDNKLPKRYSVQKCVLLGTAAYQAAQGMTDSAGQPVLRYDPTRPHLAWFNGTPVLRCDSLEAFGASKVVGVIFSLFGLRIRDAMHLLQRYGHRPARPAQTGFNLFSFLGCGYDEKAVAKLKTPAA